MKHRGTILIIAGLVLLLAALGLLIINATEEREAASSAQRVYTELAQARGDGAVASPGADPMQGTRPAATPASPGYEYIPDYLLNPNMDMPTAEIDGRLYIGTLDIPALGLSLPVLDKWSYSGLRLAPGRYTGSVYLHNIVIAAHNYASHFGGAKNLMQGDELVFTDIDGNIFRYNVLGVEILNPDETDRMITGDWDLTLFTCTYGGAQRVTVRCDLAEDIPAGISSR